MQLKKITRSFIMIAVIMLSNFTIQVKVIEYIHTHIQIYTRQKQTTIRLFKDVDYIGIVVLFLTFRSVKRDNARSSARH